MTKNTKILYLYSEIMGYNIPVLDLFEEKYNAELLVINWKKKLSDYKIEQNKNITYLYKEDFSYNELENMSLDFEPDIVVVSGWMDKDYIKIARKLKSRNIKIVGAIDAQWTNSIKQNIASLIAPFYHKKIFDYLWVSGAWQYEYARKLGYSKQNILFNCYSADVKLIQKQNFNYDTTDRKLLFVGRFDKVKGVDLLIESFLEYKKKKKTDLKLKLIGGGPEFERLIKYQSDSIEIKNFVQPEELFKEIQGVQGFVLPSNYEPWGVVIHEMALAGLPLIVTNVCGANNMFAINNYNSILIKPNCKSDLIQAISKFDNMTNDELLLMSERSKELGNRITPEISAASLLSIL